MTERTQKNILPEGLLFGEANFEERMRKEVQPWLKNQVKDGYFRSWDGSRIHYLSAVHPGERAAREQAQLEVAAQQSTNRAA